MLPRLNIPFDQWASNIETPRQPSGAQVFDMSDEEDTVDKLFADIPQDVKRTPVNETKRVGMMLSDPQEIAADAATVSPTSSQETAPPSTRHSEWCDSDLHGDVWMEDDWVSPRDRAQTSPCTSARALTRKQREVADAVLSDLQIDLQSQVQRAVNQMSSWISEEITFARQACQDDARKVRETCEIDHADMQSAQAKLTERLDQMQKSLDEQMHTIHRSQEDTGSAARPRAFSRSTPVDEQAPSANVVEAQKLAEERKLRLLQTGLDQHLERIETLDKQSAFLSERISLQEADIAGSLSAVQGLKAQMSSLKQKAEERMDSCMQKVEMVGEETRHLAARMASCTDSATLVSNLEERVAAHDTRFEARDCLIHNLEERLGSETEKLADRVAIQENSMGASGRAMHGLEEKLDQEAAKLHSDLDQHLERLENLDKVSSDLMQRAYTQDADIAGNISAVQGLQAQITTTKLSAEERASSCLLRVEMLGEEMKDLASTVASCTDTATQIFALEERLGNITDDLAHVVAVHNTKMETNEGKINGLEQRFCKEVKEFAEQIAVHDSRIIASSSQIGELEQRMGREATELAERLAVYEASGKDNATHIRGLEKKLGSKAKLLAERMAVHDASIKDNRTQIKRLEAESCRTADGLKQATGVLHDVREQASRHNMDMQESTSAFKDMRARLLQGEVDIQGLTTGLQAVSKQLSLANSEYSAERQMVYSKLETHEIEIKNLPSSVQAQLRSMEDGLSEGFAKAISDLGSKHAELAKELDGKASTSGIQEACATMQTWVDDACQAHHRTVQEFGRSLEKQDASIQRQDDWAANVHAWLEQAQERERGFSHILYRIVDEDYSQLMPLFEEVSTDSH
jgi:hypothetical protein